MRLTKVTSLSFMLIFVFFFSFFVVPAHAGLRINNPKVRLSVPQGGHQSGEIDVENFGALPVNVRVYLEDWTFSDQVGGKTFFPKGTQESSCALWMTFYPADVELEPGATQKVRYTVAVPEKAEGGYFCVMFFETGGGTVEKVDESGSVVAVKVLNRLGALFYVEPQGTVDRAGEVTRLEAGHNRNDFVLDVGFKNTGNTDINTLGTFNVFDAQGYVFARGEFETVYTLPQGQATLHAVASSVDLKPGSYDLLVTLEYEQGGALTQEASFTVDPNGTLSPLTIKD